MDDTEGSPPTLNADIETEVKEMMGLFDLPAFARRGQDLEITLRRLHERCRKARGQLLDMVQLRLRQWSRAVTGPGRLAGCLHPLDRAPLAARGGRAAAAGPNSPLPIRRQRIIAGDLVAAVLRFNRRWAAVSRTIEPRAGQHRHRPVQSLLRPRKRVRHGLGAARRPPFPTRAPAHDGDTPDDHPPLPVPELLASGPARTRLKLFAIPTTHE